MAAATVAYAAAVHDDTLPKLFAGLCCLVMWSPIAALLGWGAHYRMRSVEAADGARAEPAHEGPLLWYAVSAIAWPFAFGLAVVGLARRRWVRVGRGSAFVLLAHFTAVVLAAIASMLASGRPGGDDPLPIVIMACVVLMTGALMSAVFAWRWSGARARRIASGPKTDGGLGGARFALYAGAMFVGMIGLISPFVLTKSEDAHAAKIAFRISSGVMLAIVIGVCVGLTLLVMYAG